MAVQSVQEHNKEVLDVHPVNIEVEKVELLKWFEQNFSQFSQEKNDRLTYLTNRHEELEAKWMELQLEIDSNT